MAASLGLVLWTSGAFWYIWLARPVVNVVDISSAEECDRWDILSAAKCLLAISGGVAIYLSICVPLLAILVAGVRKK